MGSATPGHIALDCIRKQVDKARKSKSVNSSSVASAASVPALTLLCEEVRPENYHRNKSFPCRVAVILVSYYTRENKLR